MIRILLSTFLFLFLFGGAGAQASLLLEPYGGYSVGNLSATLDGATTSNSATLDGFAYGGRAGFMLGHFVILAYEYQGVSATEKQSGSTTDYSWSQGTQFVTLGFQAPMGFRLLGSYGFQMNASENTDPVTKFTGTAYKLAVGWLIMPKVAINLEYSIYNTVDIISSGTTSKVSDTYSKFNSSAAMVNISFPLTFFGSGSKSRRN